MRSEVLDQDFLETRCKILEIAAILDRIDRACARPGEHPDARLGQLRQAVEALLEPGPGRAETVQHIFSLEYDLRLAQRRMNVPTVEFAFVNGPAIACVSAVIVRSRASFKADSTMQYVDPHIHMVSRVTDDYKRMALAGCVFVSEPAFWAGFDRSGVLGFRDYFRQLTEYEPKRAAPVRDRASTAGSASMPRRPRTSRCRAK